MYGWPELTQFENVANKDLQIWKEIIICCQKDMDIKQDVTLQVMYHFCIYIISFLKPLIP